MKKGKIPCESREEFPQEIQDAQATTTTTAAAAAAATPSPSCSGSAKHLLGPDPIVRDEGNPSLNNSLRPNLFGLDMIPSVPDFRVPPRRLRLSLDTGRAVQGIENNNNNSDPLRRVKSGQETVVTDSLDSNGNPKSQDNTEEQCCLGDGGETAGADPSSPAEVCYSLDQVFSPWRDWEYEWDFYSGISVNYFFPIILICDPPFSTALLGSFALVLPPLLLSPVLPSSWDHLLIGESLQIPFRLALSCSSVVKLNRIRKLCRHLRFPEHDSALGCCLKDDKDFPDCALAAMVTQSEDSDVFKWRLVNKHWNRVCSIHLNKHKISRIHLKSDVQVMEFLETVLQPELTVFTSFSLDQVRVKGFSPAQQFFTAMGQFITGLELKHDVVLWIDGFRLLLAHLPNLTSLRMGITRFRGSRLFSDEEDKTGSKEQQLLLSKLKTINFYGGRFSFQDFLTDFCSIAPNIEVIQADPNNVPMMSKDFREKLILGCLGLRRLSKFDFCISVTEQTLKKLGGVRLPLVELSLSIREDLVRREVLFKLLSSVSATLRVCHLTFEVGAIVRKQTFELPGLKKLERLTLCNFYGGAEGLGFLQKCSLLTYLDVSEIPSYETMLPLSTMKQLRTVLELKLRPIAYPSVLAFQRVLGIFPNVKTLVLEEAEDFALTSVFMELPDVETLLLKGSFTDEGVTGIPERSESWDSSEDTELEGEQDPNNLRQSRFIGDLKKLKHLTLHSDSLTDTAFIHGVSECEHLESLSIKSERVTDVSVLIVLNQLSRIRSLDAASCPFVTPRLKKLIVRRKGEANEVCFSPEETPEGEDISPSSSSPASPSPPPPLTEPRALAKRMLFEARLRIRLLQERTTCSFSSTVAAAAGASEIEAVPSEFVCYDQGKVKTENRYLRYKSQQKILDTMRKKKWELEKDSGCGGGWEGAVGGAEVSDWNCESPKTPFVRYIVQKPDLLEQLGNFFSDNNNIKKNCPERKTKSPNNKRPRTVA